jgi:hypothetical protein
MIILYSYKVFRALVRDGSYIRPYYTCSHNDSLYLVINKPLFLFFLLFKLFHQTMYLSSLLLESSVRAARGGYSLLSRRGELLDTQVTGLTGDGVTLETTWPVPGRCCCGAPLWWFAVLAEGLPTRSEAATTPLMASDKAWHVRSMVRDGSAWSCRWTAVAA